MMQKGWREHIFTQLDQQFDLLVIGGGITGAGIFNLAARAGLSVLLVDGSDFSFGTSSRSSKLVHGGFRYLRNRQFDVTRESVRERERLLRQAPNLVTPLYFLLPCLGFSNNTRRMFRMGVTIYDFLAPKWAHGHLGRDTIRAMSPILTNPKLTDGFYYFDAEVDDARLVYRSIQEGVQAGGLAVNYLEVQNLLRDRTGQVRGARLKDRSPDDRAVIEVEAKVVVNATGPWADNLRREVGGEIRLRKLRGSHLFFPHHRLPLNQAITLLHPRDKRAMFVFPWEGVTIIGTTDLDHTLQDEQAHPEPAITTAEVGYILEAVDYLFPDQAITPADILSSISGLRPIISGGVSNPSKESRRHGLWEEDGLITITGGKLTTYRVMALDTLAIVRARLGQESHFDPFARLYTELPETIHGISTGVWKRFSGRFGELAGRVVESGADELDSIPDLPIRWAEIKWAARAEGVIHLDDLLLRRTRVGITAPDGGKAIMSRVRALAQPELGWDDARWEQEQVRYEALWRECYSVPA